MSWAEELPEASQAAAMRTSMEQWTRDDPTAAVKHLKTMPESTARDAAVSSFAQTLDREEPALAAEWAGSISDEKTRTDTMESVARSWLRSNAEEAKEWLPQSGLSAEAQQKVIEDASRGGRRGGR
jgi:ABC-type proline/glycine betaine transport system substrate-binding protein